MTAVLSRAPAAGPAVPGPGPKPPGGLTAREAEVLTLLAAGLSNAEIGKRLYPSNATVKTHINRIFAKTGARDRPRPSGTPTSTAWRPRLTDTAPSAAVTTFAGRRGGRSGSAGNHGIERPLSGAASSCDALTWADSSVTMSSASPRDG